MTPDQTANFYLITLRPLNMKRYASAYKCYDSSMSVFNRIRMSFNLKVIEFVFAGKPYMHIHAVVYSSTRLDYAEVRKLIPPGFHFDIRILRYHADVKRAVIYVQKHDPFNLVYPGETVRVINSYGKKNMEGMYMNELDERLSRLEETVSKLADVVEKLAEKVSRQTEPQSELKNAEINLSAMRVIVQKSRKGVALRIKFARFIKANNRGEYYIALTPDEYKSLIVGLQSFNVSETESNGETDTNSNGKSGRKSSKRSKTRIKSKRGGEL